MVHFKHFLLRVDDIENIFLKVGSHICLGVMGKVLQAELIGLRHMTKLEQTVGLY